MEKEKFGRWLVLEKLDKIFYLCECSCGHKRKVRKTNLLNGSSNSCGCLAREIKIQMNTDRKNSVSKETRQIKYLYSQYKSHAKYNKREFTLDLAIFRSLVFSNCHYCGNKPSNLVKNSIYGGPFFYNGIDRKDTLGHYTLENSLPCCIICNRAKNNLSYEEFINWILSLQSKFVYSK